MSRMPLLVFHLYVDAELAKQSIGWGAGVRFFRALTAVTLPLLSASTFSSSPSQVVHEWPPAIVSPCTWTAVRSVLRPGRSPAKVSSLLRIGRGEYLSSIRKRPCAET